MMNRSLFVFGLVVVAVVLGLWKKPRRGGSDVKEQVRDWENEGGRVPDVPSPRMSR